jgi:class 3 adenylate cyclase
MTFMATQARPTRTTDGAVAGSTREPGRLTLPDLIPPTTGELQPVSLRFRDSALESEFRHHYFRRGLFNIRVAHLLGIALWIVWGLLIRDYLGPDRTFDLTVRYGVFIPMLVLSLAVSYTRAYERFWHHACTALILVTGMAWTAYSSALDTMPIHFGYVGLILIMMFGFTLIRLPFVHALGASAALILGYVAIGLATRVVSGIEVFLSSIYLVSFWSLGLIASYVIERSTRLLFLRERQLDRERLRSDALLVNVLPQAIVDRLKERDEDAWTTRIADGIDEVTVLFADAVGFTVEAERTTPAALVGALDDLFSRFDAIADRLALEKIKTAGDAYIAVAGAPNPHADHVAAVAEMALAIQRCVRDLRWPSGAAIQMRIGIATGPVVAGVIGRRKFAYDLWGPTMNLASRLQSRAEPGEILVSEAAAARLDGRFSLSPGRTLDVKGKGPTPVRSLVGEGAASPRRP